MKVDHKFPGLHPHLPHVKFGLAYVFLNPKSMAVGWTILDPGIYERWQLQIDLLRIWWDYFREANDVTVWFGPYSYSEFFRSCL